jgi:hypothetical protein
MNISEQLREADPQPQRQWKPYTLTDPRNNMRKGGISLPADPQACSDKTARIIGKALGAPRNVK